MILAKLVVFSVQLAWLLSCASSSEPNGRAQLLKNQAQRVYLSLRRSAYTQCSNEPQSGPSLTRVLREAGPGFEPDSLEPGRGRRAISTSDGRNIHGTSVLVTSSRGHLLLDEHRIPEHVFTVALWCKPEGGQASPSVILEASDACLPFPDRGWILGLRSSEASGERDLRIFYSLHTWSKNEASYLTSPLPVVTGKWTHIAAVYDGHKMHLYIDGAKIGKTVDLSEFDKGQIVMASRRLGHSIAVAARLVGCSRSAVVRVTDSQSSHPLGASICRSIYLGGSESQHFRGRLDDFRLWNSALSQDEIQAAMSHQRPDKRPLAEDNFDTLDLWEWLERNHVSDHTYKAPVLVPSDLGVSLSASPPKPNPCGLTICDASDITRSYKGQWMLRKHKVLRYRVIVVSNNDRSNPTVTQKQIDRQHLFLTQAFIPYNISWELEQVMIRNSSLRRRTVLLSCDSSMVGNGVCEPECLHLSTGNDGGDCGTAASAEDSCVEEMLGNGICDNVCNVFKFLWDGGDCCDADSTACYDPNSPYRSYMDVQEFKSQIQLKNLDSINILFALWTDKNILGVATFPWEKSVFTEQGGIVLQPSEYGKEGSMSTLVHELGHALGLWHVHHGVSEVPCRHPCYESVASSTNGDLCSDTGPTPENNHCRDPTPEQNVCGKTHFTGTPYKNYMGYGDDSCVSEFSEEQAARMHCYIDLVYTAAQKRSQVNQLPPPPLAPKVIRSTPTSLTMSWITPLASASFYDTNICTFCSEKLEFSQYGFRAESADHMVMPAGAWSPQQAAGAPDADSCGPSYQAWLPGTKSCPDEVCTLTVHFEHPTVASLLIIWITWNAFNGLHAVEVVFDDGSSDSLGNLHAQCDTPLTIPLFYKSPITKIHIRTRNIFVSIDAVKLISVSNSPLCTPCKPFRYRLLRNPPFSAGESRDLDDDVFTDRNLQPNTKYEYKVQAWLGSRVSEFSPILSHVTGSPVCGDGLIDRDEDCDDGNLLDGDGCSSSCSVEDFFHCTSEPSLCAWHEGDGVCEAFERGVSVEDCGFFTPRGFTDQWADTVFSGPEDIALLCPPTAVIGPPSLPLDCKGDLNISTSWYSCDYETEVWLLVEFPQPVVATSVLLYLASDGDLTGLVGWAPSSITLRLLDAKGLVHHEQNVDVSCSQNPQEVPILWDLSVPLRRTSAVNLTFTSAEIAISGICLRSSNAINPMSLDDCPSGNLYHPGLHKCDSFCQLPPCPPLLAKHAHLTCTGHREGHNCTVVCDPGHSRHDDLQPVVCMGGEWRGSDPNCKPIDCGLPVLTHADAVCPEGTTFGRTCTYKCRPPARLLGGANGFSSIQCEANGLWSRPHILCQVTCAPPIPPSHTVLASPRCRNADTFVFGQRCRFRCKRGYHVQNFGLRKRILHLRCDITASWSGPKCVPIRCPRLNVPSHDCSAGYSVGSECSVTCNSRTQEVVTSIHQCELDGTWHPNLPECYLPISCPPPVSEHPGIQFLCDGNNIGAACKASCIDPTEQVVLSSTNERIIKFQCQENGLWSRDFQDFMCKKACIENYNTDGYCDARNNHEHCDWDGGDCCPSTVAGGTVKPFPANCGDPCGCFDPKAKENLKTPS